MVHIAWGIIVACGRDEQLSSEVDTAFLHLGGKPMLSYSVDAFEGCPEIDGIAIVAAKDRLAEIQHMVQLFGYSKVRRIAAGTRQRTTSVRTGLDVIDEDVSIVVIHEASRPCVSSDLIAETVKAAKRYGSGVAAAKIPDSVKLVEKGQKVSKSVAANVAWAAQTPQAFKRDILEKALKAAAKRKGSLQDEAEAIERTKNAVHIVPSTSSNLKIFTAEDLALAEALVRIQ